MVKIRSEAGGPEYALLEENDVVQARLAGVEEHSFTWDNETVDKFKWTFVITDPEAGDWDGKEIFGDTSQVFTAHPNCKAYSWVKAITGRAYEQGEELDTDDLLGMPCRVMITHKDDKQGRTWMRVKEVLPAKAATRGVLTSAPVDEAPF